MAKNKLVAPFLKWVGGKRQIMSVIEEHLPAKISNYYALEIWTKIKDFNK